MPNIPEQSSYRDYVTTQLEAAIEKGRQRGTLLELLNIDPFTTYTAEQISALGRNGVISPQIADLINNAMFGGEIHPGTIFEVLEKKLGGPRAAINVLEVIRDGK